MAVQNGQLVVLQKPDDPDTPTAWTNLCGGNAHNFDVVNALIESKKVNCSDRTKVDINRRYGAQDFNLSISGVFDDDAAGQHISDAAVGRTTLETYRLVVPGVGTFTGDWLVENFKWTGDMEADLTFDCSLKPVSTAGITFVSA